MPPKHHLQTDGTVWKSARDVTLVFLLWYDPRQEGPYINCKLHKLSQILVKIGFDPMSVKLKLRDFNISIE